MAGAGEPISADAEVGLQLAAARELLGMELAYFAELRGGHQIYRAVDGDGAPFGVELGASVPLDGGCCGPVEGSLPIAIGDTGCRQGVRSYLCVPVRSADGRLFGSMCCVSEKTDTGLGDGDVHLMEVMARLIADRMEREQLAADRRALERETGRRQIEATGVGAFLTALEMRDSYTGRHCDAVVELALEVGDGLGLDVSARREVGQVALLHDIGKIGVPDSILQKPGPLTDREWEVMRTHPELGAQMVASVVGLGHLASAVRAEHERWDGRGYPDGLRGEEIPMASRIVFACDAFHAMTSNRPYRAAMTTDAAMSELERCRGGQFCPTTLEALLGKVSPVEEALRLPA